MYTEGTFVLDVRTPEEWNEFHAPDTTLIPLDELAARVNELPKDQPIVVVCRSGNRSQAGRDILLQAGFNATSMSGGLNEWRDSGLSRCQRAIGITKTDYKSHAQHEYGFLHCDTISLMIRKLFLLFILILSACSPLATDSPETAPRCRGLHHLPGGHRPERGWRPVAGRVAAALWRGRAQLPAHPAGCSPDRE